MTVTWDPVDYARSSSAQLAWAREVIGRLGLEGNEQVLDVGCGDGKVSAEFLRHVPRGSVAGIDNSPEMIAHALKTYPPGEYRGLSFHVMDACSMDLPRRFDVAFSNAALHWIEDHGAVLKGVSRLLVPGGRLIISCGGRGNAEGFAVSVEEVTRRPRWSPYFRDFPFPYFFRGPEEYLEWLTGAGLQPRRVELVPKDMVHGSVGEFSSWVRTTWMPYAQRVPADEQGEFIAEAVEAYVSAHPPDDAGATHVGMVRLEVEAEKK
jgi:trans-aconitate 2-methyltransferase